MPGLQRPWFCLFAIGVLSCITGWLLADFQVPVWVYGISFGLVTHLVWVGTDAIFLAMVWLTAGLWVGVIRFSWPASFKPPYEIPGFVLLWTICLGATWLITAGLIVSLAMSQRSLAKLGYPRGQIVLILVVLTWSSWGIGWMINQSRLLPIH